MFADAPEMDGPTEVFWDEEEARQGRAEYRKRRRMALGQFDRQARLRAALCEEQRGLCHYCGCKMLSGPVVSGQRVPDEQVTLEHLLSHADGGKTSKENCRAACHGCNGLKGKLDHAARRLERAMGDGFEYEVHFYAARLTAAITAWDERVSGGRAA